MKKVNAIIQGTSIVYDVPTKCTVVHSLATTKFVSKEAQNKRINDIARSLGVNPVTVKSWVSKYIHTYKEGMKLSSGTMRHEFLTIPGGSIPEVRKKLVKIKAKIKEVTIEHSVTYSGIDPEVLRQRPTPNEILEGFINIKKG